MQQGALTETFGELERFAEVVVLVGTLATVVAETIRGETCETVTGVTGTAKVDKLL